MKLKTKRLILRQPKIKDAKDIIEGINNLNISKWLLVVPYPYTMKDARWYINHCAEKNKQKKKDSYSFSIELKSEKKIIGGCGISKIDNHSKTAELGYWLNENYWRQGLITEAINVYIKKHIADIAPGGEIGSRIIKVDPKRKREYKNVIVLTDNKDIVKTSYVRNDAELKSFLNKYVYNIKKKAA